MTTNDATFEGWCILELMGHRRLAGMVQEVEIAGAGFLRIDIPATPRTGAATQFYPPSSVYALTPTSEEIVRRVAAHEAYEPVSRWEVGAAMPIAVLADDRYRDGTVADDWRGSPEYGEGRDG